MQNDDRQLNQVDFSTSYTEFADTARDIVATGKID